jgi:hypothetical protein
MLCAVAAQFQAVLAAYHASSTGQLAASKVLQQLYEGAASS